VASSTRDPRAAQAGTAANIDVLPPRRCRRARRALSVAENALGSALIDLAGIGMTPARGSSDGCALNRSYRKRRRV
jgi:hypothetical protein